MTDFLIFARGGSKRLPNKNIKDFCGKPLIAWTIIAAKKSKYFSNLVVSTDCSKIKSVCDQYGANTHIRPKYLAKDHTSSITVMNYLINNIKLNEEIVLLQPTSPLRTEEHIDELINFAKKKAANSVISISKTDKPLNWNFFKDENHLLTRVANSNKSPKNQFLKKTYTGNGAIYYTTKNFFLKHKSFINKNTIGFELPKLVSQDIDDKLDFQFAEFIAKNYFSERFK